VSRDAFRGGANPGEQYGFIGKAEASRQRLGDERGLIVAALALGAAMQGNGHDHVGFKRRDAEDSHFCEHAGEQFTERVDIFKFQEEDGLDHGAIVERPGSDAVEGQTAMVGIGTARADEGALIFSRGAFDWRAALIANGSGDLLKGTEALIADGNAGGFGEHAIADAAAG
jgi:hypothetical protein